MSDGKQLTLNDDDQYDWDGTRDKIIELRARGNSQAVIAKAIGKSVPFVAKILKSELIDRASNRQELIASALCSLNWVQQLLGERIAKAGDKFQRADVTEFRATIADIRKLLALDQPVEHNVNVQVEEVSDEDVRRQLAAFVPTHLLPAITSTPALPESIPDAEYHVRPEADEQRVGEEGSPKVEQ